MKTVKFSLVVRTRENTDVFITLGQKVNIFYLSEAKSETRSDVKTELPIWTRIHRRSDVTEILLKGSYNFRKTTSVSKCCLLFKVDMLLLAGYKLNKKRTWHSVWNVAFHMNDSGLKQAAEMHPFCMSHSPVCPNHLHAHGPAVHKKIRYCNTNFNDSNTDCRLSCWFELF